MTAALPPPPVHSWSVVAPLLLLTCKLSLGLLAPLLAGLYVARLVAAQGPSVFSAYSIVTLTNTSVLVVVSSFLQVMFFTGGRALGRADRDGYLVAMRAGCLCALALGFCAALLSVLLGPFLSAMGYAADLVSVVGWQGLVAALGVVPLVLQVVVRVDASLNGKAGSFTTVVVAGAVICVVGAHLVIRMATTPQTAAASVLFVVGLVQWVVLSVARPTWPRMLRESAFWHFKVGPHIYRFAWKDLWFYGWPIGAVVLMDSGVKVLTTLAMARWWIDTVPIHSAMVLWLALALIVPLGLSQAGMQKVAIAHARGDARQQSVTTWIALALAAVYGAMAAGALNLFAVEAGELLLTDVASYRQDQLRTLILPASLVLFAESLVVVAAGLLRGIGLTRSLLVQALVSYAVFGPGAQLLFSGVFGFGAAGLWWGLVAGFWIAAAAITSHCVLNVGRLGSERSPHRSTTFREGNI